MRIDVLDHGYVALVESWGSDARVIEAARMSTAKGFQGWGTNEAPGDEKLLRFLWKNAHHTPFEMAGLIVEVQAPIFVFREWHRHRTQSYNELSARYTAVPDVNYQPTKSRIVDGVAAAGRNKQAAGSQPLIEDEVDRWLFDLHRAYAACEKLYQDGIAIGLPKEVARVIMPVGRYSRMRASANLRNWLAFLALRLPTNAQWEIRQYAAAVDQMVAAAFPRTHALVAESR